MNRQGPLEHRKYHRLQVILRKHYQCLEQRQLASFHKALRFLTKSSSDDSESEIILLLEEVSMQGITCPNFLKSLFKFVYPFLSHCDHLADYICYDTSIIECSNDAKVPITHNYRLVDYVFSKLITNWEERETWCFPRLRIFYIFKILIHFGISSSGPRTFCGEVELRPELLVDFLVLALAMYYSQLFGHDGKSHHLDDNVIEAWKELITLALRASKPIPLSMIKSGTMKMGKDVSEVGTVIEMLKRTEPLAVEILGSRVVSLKHLCRCVVRQQLRENWELPNGVFYLDVPDNLVSYLNLQED